MRSGYSVAVKRSLETSSVAALRLTALLTMSRGKHFRFGGKNKSAVSFARSVASFARHKNVWRHAAEHWNSERRRGSTADVGNQNSVKKRVPDCERRRPNENPREASTSGRAYARQRGRERETTHRALWRTTTCDNRIKVASVLFRAAIACTSRVALGLSACRINADNDPLSA